MRSVVVFTTRAKDMSNSVRAEPKWSSPCHHGRSSAKSSLIFFSAPIPSAIASLFLIQALSKSDATASRFDGILEHRGGAAAASRSGAETNIEAINNNTGGPYFLDTPIPQFQRWVKLKYLISHSQFAQVALPRSKMQSTINLQHEIRRCSISL